MHLQGVHDYLTNITNDGANDDIVFMMDALDIWLQLSPRTLVERFEDLGTSGVVVGAETSCWPNPQDSVSARIHGVFLQIFIFLLSAEVCVSRSPKFDSSQKCLWLA